MVELFDILQSDSLGQIKIEDVKNFLMHRRQKRRPGSVFGVNQKLNITQGRKSTEAIETARNKKLIHINLLHEKLISQAGKAVVVMTTVKILLSSFSNYQQQ